jgi:hypothetical protein
MANIGHFDATNIAPREDFSPIPTGEYPALIIDSDLKPTKSNNGHYLELTCEVSAGEYKGRRVWARLNLDNPNPKAVEIAQRELSAICHATGVMKVTDSAQLHNKPLVIRVEYVEAGGNRNSPTNEIKAWKAPEAGAVVQQRAAAPAATTTGAAPPWAQRAA